MTATVTGTTIATASWCTTMTAPMPTRRRILTATTIAVTIAEIRTARTTTRTSATDPASPLSQNGGRAFAFKSSHRLIQACAALADGDRALALGRRLGLGGRGIGRRDAVGLFLRQAQRAQLGGLGVGGGAFTCDFLAHELVALFGRLKMALRLGAGGFAFTGGSGIGQ